MTMDELCQKKIKTGDIAKILEINKNEVAKYKALKREDDPVFKLAIERIKNLSGIDHRTAKKLVKEIKNIYKIK